MTPRDALRDEVTARLDAEERAEKAERRITELESQLAHLTDQAGEDSCADEIQRLTREPATDAWEDPDLRSPAVDEAMKAIMAVRDEINEVDEDHEWTDEGATAFDAAVEKQLMAILHDLYVRGRRDEHKRMRKSFNAALTKGRADGVAACIGKLREKADGCLYAEAAELLSDIARAWEKCDGVTGGALQRMRAEARVGGRAEACGELQDRLGNDPGYGRSDPSTNTADAVYEWVMELERRERAEGERRAWTAAERLIETSAVTVEGLLGHPPPLSAIMEAFAEARHDLAAAVYDLNEGYEQRSRERAAEERRKAEQR